MTDARKGRRQLRRDIVDRLEVRLHEAARLLREGKQLGASLDSVRRHVSDAIRDVIELRGLLR